MWVGKTPMSQDLLFEVPQFFASELLENGKEGSKYKIVNGKVLGRSTSMWLTNIEHGRRHQPLELMSMADNIKYSKHKEIRGKEYAHYDNYDAIDVPRIDAIPNDYDGVMGVPVSFIDKYCPEQFEVIGITENKNTCNNEYVIALMKPKCLKYDRPYINNKRGYARILIRKKQ